MFGWNGKVLLSNEKVNLKSRFLEEDADGMKRQISDWCSTRNIFRRCSVPRVRFWMENRRNSIEPRIDSTERLMGNYWTEPYVTLLSCEATCD